jgi:pimeloyl-ACP methyl ester carboxylesterase
MTIDHRIETRDGRTLQVVEGGAPDGAAVLVHNGTPNSRLLFGPWVALAERQGIRLISYDRPGYGGSTRQAGHSVADCAEDVRAIAAALGIDRLGVWGISGGGPRALACAALLPDLVPAVASLASIAPWGAPGLDFFDGMGEMNVEEVTLLVTDPVAARARCEQERLETMALGADQLVEYLKTLLSPVDAALVTGELADYLVETGLDGLAPGADGWWDDSVALAGPWGFELSSIRIPVLLRQGRQDRFVPFGHGQWLAGQIPGVQAELTDDDGHLTLTEQHLEQVHDWLLERIR